MKHLSGSLGEFGPVDSPQAQLDRIRQDEQRRASSWACQSKTIFLNYTELYYAPHVSARKKATRTRAGRTCGGLGVNSACTRRPCDLRTRLKLCFVRLEWNVNVQSSVFTSAPYAIPVLAGLGWAELGWAELGRAKLSLSRWHSQRTVKMPAWEASILHSFKQLLKLMTHCQVHHAIRRNKQARRRRRSLIANGGVQVMRSHGSQGVGELIVLSFPPDPHFVSVRSPSYKRVQLPVGTVDSGLHRTGCWKWRERQLVRGQRSL